MILHMETLTIRKSGNANIVSIPKTLLKTLGLGEGDKLNVEIKDSKIILSPYDNTLQSLLQDSAPASFEMLEEDIEWDLSIKGNEV